MYGDDIDKIVQGNINNIIFLKSTDNDMIETLSKMSGITHKVYRDGKTVTTDVEKILLPTEGKISYNMGAKERPLISYNDLAYLPERNSIIFRGGQNPIWNRNETILPMSWRLLQDNPKIPGRKFSFQTMPTMSSAKDFDVRKNQPDFVEMVYNRMNEAKEVDDAIENYKRIYNYTDYDIEQLDPDLYARDIMNMVNAEILKNKNIDDQYSELEDKMGQNEEANKLRDKSIENKEVTDVVESNAVEKADWEMNRYADGYLSRNDLVQFKTHQVNPQFETHIVESFIENFGFFQQDSQNFMQKGDDFYSADGSVLYLKKMDEKKLKEYFNEKAKDPNSKVFAESIDEEGIEGIRKDCDITNNYIVTTHFYKFLVSLDSWKDIADGHFEETFSSILHEEENK